MDDEFNEEQHTAYHEAAHAVIGYRIDVEGYEISIVPNKEKGSVGYHAQEPWDLTEKSARKQIIIYLAGMEADRIAFNGMIPLGGDEDEEMATFLRQYLSSGETLEMLRIEAMKIVRKNWKHISAVAEELQNAKILCKEEWELIVDWIDEKKNWKEKLQFFRMNDLPMKSNK